MCLCLAKKNPSLLSSVVPSPALDAASRVAASRTAPPARRKKAESEAERVGVRRRLKDSGVEAKAAIHNLVHRDENRATSSTQSSTRTVAQSDDSLSAVAEVSLDGVDNFDDNAQGALESVVDEEIVDESDSVVASEATPLPIDPAKAAFLLTLQRAKEGDRKAFEEIYQLYHRRIYNAVYGMLSDPDDAQDVTQDVFIRLHDALPTLRADEAFSTYLYRIALNLCRDRARRKKRVRFQSMDTPRSDSEGDMEPMEFPDTAKLPEETLTNDELQMRVREAVQTLSVDHKAVIVMHHFQGMEVNDIANILKVPTGTVKSRLARGRDQLHRKLRTYLGVAA